MGPVPYTEDHLSGWKVGGTSQIAAEEARPSAETIMRRIREWMHSQPRPVTADEIADGLGLNALSVRPRLTTLKNRNLIRDSGQVGRSSMGKKMTRWELC